MQKFTITANCFLFTNTTGYYHTIYKGFREDGNPDFINYLKNTFATEKEHILTESCKKLHNALLNDVSKILELEKLNDCVVICVPRARIIADYNSQQLLFSNTVYNFVETQKNLILGKNAIKRKINTKTTHIKKPISINNNFPEPYPGITKKTCVIDGNLINGKNILLIDDIYTKSINIDEDCIQALYEHGAKKIVFYSIGYTQRV